MYAIVTALGLCSVTFALRFARRREGWCAVGYALTASMALYTDQTSVLPLLLANLLWGGLWLHRRDPATGRGWRDLAEWVALQFGVGAAFWLWWSHAQFPSLFGAGTLYQVAMLMLVLERLGITVGIDQVTRVLIAAAALLAVGGGWACWLAARSRRIGAGRTGADAQSMPAAPAGMTRGLAWVMIVAFVLGTVGSAVPRLFTLKRLLVSLLPYGLLVGAWAMQTLHLKRWMLSTLVLFSLALSVVNIALWPKEPWREVVAVVERAIGPEDQVWVDELAVPAFDYYYTGSHERLILRVARLREFHDALTAERQSQAPRGRIWVVTKVDPYRNLLDYLSGYLSENLVWAGDWHHVSVRAYALPLSGSAPLVPGADPPPWLLDWPSPVHEACHWRD